MNRRPLFISLIVLFTLCVTMQAQPITNSTSMNEGVHFEVAFGVVWPVATEKPLPQPLLLIISSRYATKVTVFSASDLGGINKTYTIAANNVLRVEIKVPYLSPTAGGKRSNVISITSEAPVSVATYIAYAGNGTMTLQYPVETWGTSYHVFSNPQDEYGANTYIQRRPGQIVVVAAEDNTLITIQSPIRIAKSSDNGPIVPNTPKILQLMAHETLTVLGEIDSTKSHTASTDLTGTRITSTKPIAVLSGHTKGAIGIKYPLLPPTGMFASEAHFIRNCYSQAILHDGFADTSFVTVPMLYTSTRITSGTEVAPADVVRILSIQNGTLVRRSRMDGTGYMNVATLDSGKYFTDTLVTSAYRWTCSKPALVTQYGKSYAKVLPPGGAPPTTGRKVSNDVLGHPTVVSGMPTMMVVPGESQWVERATFYAPSGMDNFLSIVMKSEDTSSILVDGKTIIAPALAPIPGTPLAYARIAIPEGNHHVTTAPSAKFMAWNHGSLDGLAQGRAYSHPVGMSSVGKCADSIVVRIDRYQQYARARANIDTSTDCSSILRYEVLASKNAYIDSVDFQIGNADSIAIFVLPTKPDSAGTLTVRFTSTSGRYVDADLYAPPVPPAPRVRHHVLLQIQAAKRYDTIVASVILDSAIDTRFTQCFVTMQYDTRSIRRVTPFTVDSTTGTVHKTSFTMPITNHTTGSLIGAVAFVYQTPDSSIFPRITSIVWLEGSTPQSNVDNIFRTVVIDTLPDTTQVGVDNDTPSDGQSLTLALSPQPAHDNVSITYRMGQQGAALRAASGAPTLRIYDYRGVLVMELSDKLLGEEGTVVVNARALVRGVYVVRLSNGGATCVSRLVVE